MEAELHDGTVLEFPDGTDPAIVQATVKRHLGLAPPATTSQTMGFAQGMGRVADNLAPLTDRLMPWAAPLMHRADQASDEQIKQREIAGQLPGKAGETAGEFVGAMPTWFMGGPAMSGAIQGYATSHSDDLLGRSVDAAKGALGGKVAGVAMQKLADAVAPVIDPAVRRLIAQGVKLTPGQIRGGKAMVAEDKLMSRPIVGDTIGTGRRESLETTNLAGVNHVLAALKQKLPVGVAAGHDAIDHAHRAVSDAYDAVVPNMAAQIDPRFVVGARKIYQDLATLPEAQQGQFDAVLKALRFGQNGTIAGKQLQNGLSEVGRLKAAYSSSANASERELGRVLGSLRDELGQMVERQNPALAPAFKDANAGFRRLAVMENAASRADDGVASTAQIRQAARQADPSRRKADTARGVGFMQDFVKDIRQVIPAKIGDSFTSGRTQAGQLIPTLRGAASNVSYKTDEAIARAIAKAPPQVQETLRGVLLALKRPAGVAGATALTYQPGE